MYTVGNIYVIAAVAVVGGALFGFDISSISAIISEEPYLCYFNQGPLYKDTDGKCSGPRNSVQSKLHASMPWDLTSLTTFSRRYHSCCAGWIMAWSFDFWVS